LFYRMARTVLLQWSQIRSRSYPQVPWITVELSEFGAGMRQPRYQWRVRVRALWPPRRKLRLVAAVAIIVTALIAVGGWLVSQYQARRATRRNMRIEYLLQAYRRLERASNRPLTPENARELEPAVADVMLLGSERQAELAAQFSNKFAAEHVANMQPLLLDLRASLRNELLLGELPSSTCVSLRINADDDYAVETAHVWRDALQSAQRSLMPELASVEANYYEIIEPSGHKATAQKLSPRATVVVNAANVEHLLRELLAISNSKDSKGLSTPQLASRALRLGLIDANLTDAINGLETLRTLAIHDPDRLTEVQAGEYASTSAAVAYVLQIAIRRRKASQPKT
jgi:hypothetical protein